MSPACFHYTNPHGMCTLVKCTCLPVMYARVGCNDLPVFTVMRAHLGGL